MDGANGCLNVRWLTIQNAKECGHVVGSDVDNPDCSKFYEAFKAVEILFCFILGVWMTHKKGKSVVWVEHVLVGNRPYCWKKCSAVKKSLSFLFGEFQDAITLVERSGTRDEDEADDSEEGEVDDSDDEEESDKKKKRTKQKRIKAKKARVVVEYEDESDKIPIKIASW